MTTSIRDQYRLVFSTPGAEDVLEDLARYIQSMEPVHQGAASLVMLRIQRMRLRVEPRPKPRAIPAAGRIERIP